MRKLIVIVHTSLDGYVSGLDGEFDGFETGEENLEFVCSLTRSADAALFGRKSFEKMNPFWSIRKDHPDATWNEIVYSHWYDSTKKYVVSSKMKSSGNVIVLDGHPLATIRKIKATEGKNILVFGSPSLSQALFKACLVDGIWIFINAVIFGKGIRLFSGQEDFTRLKLVETKQLSFGEIAVHYHVSNEHCQHKQDVSCIAVKE